MHYCENCGNEIKESAKFCQNCGNKIDIVVEEENTQNEIDAIGDYIKNKLDDAFGSSDDELFEPFEDYDWEEYFGHLPSKLKVYLGENIPQKKLNAFKRRIKKNYVDKHIDNCTNHLVL